MKARAGHPSIPLKDVLYLSGFALLGWCRPAETGQAHVRIYWTAWHSARGLCCHISLLGGPHCWMPVTGYWQLQPTTCSSASGYGWPGADSAGPHASLAARQSAPSPRTHTQWLFCFNKLTLKWLQEPINITLSLSLSQTVLAEIQTTREFIPYTSRSHHHSI